MKQKTIAIVVCMLVVGSAIGVALGGTTQFIGQLQAINNATNGTAPVSFGSFRCFPSSSFAITNAGLSTTNALTIKGQFSIDGSNWLTITTYHPAGTTATNEVWTPVVTNQPAYWRLLIETTNSVDLSVVGQY